jgi:hypothetical protein
MVRCRLDNSLDSSNLRFVPAAEFDAPDLVVL